MYMYSISYFVVMKPQYESTTEKLQTVGSNYLSFCNKQFLKYNVKNDKLDLIKYFFYNFRLFLAI